MKNMLELKCLRIVIPLSGVGLLSSAFSVLSSSLDETTAAVPKMSSSSFSRLSNSGSVDSVFAL